LSRQHIVICSYEFGPQQGPEGICTQRLANALADAGMRETVISSGTSGNEAAPSNCMLSRHSSLPFAPHNLFLCIDKLIANWRLLGKNYHIFWQARILVGSSPQKVDVVYGRCMPFSSIMLAWFLSKKLKKPLIVHFSDPVISPWYMPSGMPLKFLKYWYARITHDAAAISFVTPEAIAFSEKVTGIALGHKAFVLNHIAPEPSVLDAPENQDKTVFLYAGRFYGHRSPDALLAGLALYLKCNSTAVFRFLGADPVPILRIAGELGITDNIEVLPFSRDVISHFKDANVLVALDAMVGEPVFLSTKIVEYLMVDRFVLLVSPSASPASRLVRRFSDTALQVSGDPYEIANGMNDMALRAYTKESFVSRFDGIKDYSAESVAQVFLCKMDELGIACSTV